MARVDNFTRFERREYDGAPDWFFRFLDHLNAKLEPVVTALQSRLTTENENAEVIAVSVYDLTTFEVRAPSVTGEVEQVEIVWSDLPYNAFHWERTTEGANVTIGFSGSPTDLTDVRLKVKGGE